ncbi:MAG TPA: transglycosylase SLT domain-containing protein [Candidatus Krumholzibacteria bacterium]|nr:transglycosylase SLT domain-containing protein [Candidatus Krumholzibacteria bacterium]
MIRPTRTRGAAPLTLRLPAALLLLALAAAGCGERIDGDAAARDHRTPLVPHPQVERDLDAIGRTGVLRMIARYNSSSYFVHKGGQAGFDYELLVRFAREQGLTVEVVVPEPGEDEVSLLNAGHGDVACTGTNPDEDLARWVAWTRPTNFVRKAVVTAADDPRGDDPATWHGAVLTLPAGDPFRADLLKLRDETGARFRVVEALPSVSPEDLLAQVESGAIEAAVVDDVGARASLAYRGDLRIAALVGDVRPAVWLVRHNSPELLAALNRYLKEQLSVTEAGRTRRGQTYGIIYDRYFENPLTIRGFQEAAHRPDKSGRISRYDDLIRAQARPLGLDWRLVAALVYQESRFYPYALSKAGARGLMQVLPAFAGDQADSLYDPAANLRAGLRLLNATWNAYAYLDSTDRVRFTLAEYHAGNGHVTDARRLAMDMGRDPNHWDGSLGETLPLLEDPRWYGRLRHGFYRGTRTVDYVDEILARYRAYSRLVPLDPGAVADSVAFDLPGDDAALLESMPDLQVDRPEPR